MLKDHPQLEPEIIRPQRNAAVSGSSSRFANIRRNPAAGMPAPPLSRTESSLNATLAGMSCHTDVDVHVGAQQNVVRPYLELDLPPLEDGQRNELVQVSIHLENLGPTKSGRRSRREPGRSPSPEYAARRSASQ